jgi:hypothetical protein
VDNKCNTRDAKCNTLLAKSPLSMRIINDEKGAACETYYLNCPHHHFSDDVFLLRNG